MKSANIQEVRKTYMQLHYEKLIELSATKTCLLEQLPQNLVLAISISATKQYGLACRVKADLHTENYRR